MNLILQIQPVIQFKNQCTVSAFKKWVGKIVVSIYQKQITHGFKTVLQSAIDIYIIALGIVLEKGGPENFSRKINFCSLRN